MKRLFAIFLLLIAIALSSAMRAQADERAGLKPLATGIPVARGFSPAVSDLDRQAAQLQEQGPALQAFLKRSHEGQVDPQFAAEVLNRAKTLEDQGLPAEPYLLKANEGLAKRVPPKRMAPALEATTERTRSAASLVDEAMKRGATASPQARRQAILQFQSELMTGRSQSDLEKAIQAGFSKGGKPNLSHLADEVLHPGHGKKEKSTEPPLPNLEYSPGSEKPSKAVAPSKPKHEKSPPGIEKGRGKSKNGGENSGHFKVDHSSPSHGNSSGKKGGKGRGK